MNLLRRRLKESGERGIPADNLENYAMRYDEIVEEGRRENKTTRGKIARKEEKALVNRLEKYKWNQCDAPAAEGTDPHTE